MPWTWSMRWSRRETSSVASGGSWNLFLAGEMSMITVAAPNTCGSLTKDLDVSQAAADLGFWRRCMTSVAAHTIYSRMSMIPIAPWASVAFPLYRVYRTPRPSSGNVSRLSACPTEAMSERYIDRLGGALGRSAPRRVDNSDGQRSILDQCYQIPKENNRSIDRTAS